jgi:DNA-binding protein HU-beta
VIDGIAESGSIADIPFVDGNRINTYLRCTVNKNEFVSAVAEKAKITKTDAATAVDAVFDVITEALQHGDEVRLVGFGNFVVTERAASEGRNPRTGEAISIPASKQPKFKPGKGLKDALN